MVNQKISLEEAKIDESKRPRFLAELLSEPIPYCEGICYDPDGKLAKEWFEEQLRGLGASEEIASQVVNQPLMQRSFSNSIAGFPTASYLLGSGNKPPLFVGTRLFSKNYTEGEIRHLLREHEGTHFRQVAIGIPYFDTVQFRDAWIENKIRPITAHNIVELDANHQSLKALQEGKYEVRINYGQRVLGHYLSGITSLYNLFTDSKSEEEMSFIRQTLKGVPHTLSKN
ncbi:MAG: hypothetical protein ABIH37_02080 [archaeon]